ncbi:hypothetical protein ACYOEI_23830, partial [Singulisphaera rosea]
MTDEVDVTTHVGSGLRDQLKVWRVTRMTKPTRLQEQACERLAEALLLVTEGARLDDRGTFGAA